MLGADGLPLSRRPPNYTIDPLRSNADPVSETIEDFNGGFRIITEQTCDDTISAVSNAEEIIPKKTKVDGARYAGSVPAVQALIWAKECAAAVGTREWIAYANKKMKGGGFEKLRANLK